MIDAFEEKARLQNTYLMNPFTVFTSINLNKGYRPGQDAYKYQINTLITSINFSLTPDIVKDMLRFKSFFEMFSYAKDLKRFRPYFKIEHFLEKKLNMQQKRVKPMVIRDWFRLVLWYVRLRKAAKG